MARYDFFSITKMNEFSPPKSLHLNVAAEDRCYFSSFLGIGLGPGQLYSTETLNPGGLSY